MKKLLIILLLIGIVLISGCLEVRPISYDESKDSTDEDEGIEIARLEFKYYDNEGNEIDPEELFGELDDQPEDLPNMPEPREEDWYVVETFSGTGPKTTAPFQIESRRWRYTLTCKNMYSGSDGGYNLQISKLVGDEPQSVDFKMMAICKETDEPSYVYDGAGTYFMDFTPANVKSWKITVEAIKKTLDWNKLDGQDWEVMCVNFEKKCFRDNDCWEIEEAREEGVC